MRDRGLLYVSDCQPISVMFRTRTSTFVPPKYREIETAKQYDRARKRYHATKTNRRERCELRYAVMMRCLQASGTTDFGHYVAMLSEYYKWRADFRGFMYKFVKSMFFGELTIEDANILSMCVASFVHWFGCETRDYFVKGYDVTQGYDLEFLEPIVTTLLQKHFPVEYESYLNYVQWQKRGGYRE